MYIYCMLNVFTTIVDVSCVKLVKMGKRIRPCSFKVAKVSWKCLCMLTPFSALFHILLYMYINLHQGFFGKRERDCLQSSLLVELNYF